MSTNEMRRLVCKKAHELMKHYRHNGMNRATAFRWAWAQVKQLRAEAQRSARMIKAADLKSGDVVRMEYGDFGNVVTCTITGRRMDPWSGLVIKAQYRDGRQIEFCPAPAELVERVVA